MGLIRVIAALKGETYQPVKVEKVNNKTYRATRTRFPKYVAPKRHFEKVVDGQMRRIEDLDRNGQVMYGEFKGRPALIAGDEIYVPVTVMVPDEDGVLTPVFSHYHQIF